MIKQKTPAMMVVFGGTGDLTKRKLIPAIYQLICQDLLSPHFAIICTGRTEYTHESYRKMLKQSVEEFASLPLHEENWTTLSKRIYYQCLRFDNHADYELLAQFLLEIEEAYQTLGNRFYYLAVSPDYFSSIITQLKAAGMVINKESWQRLVIEKPFGRDLNTARHLNGVICKVFSEVNTYRIDHYLGKEMIQNSTVIRFGNLIFEPLWNARYIDNVQINVSETDGVGSRGGYYDKAGALRDMVQNHLFQLLSITAMEPPKSMTADDVREEKVKVIRSLKPIIPEQIRENLVLGQYEGYQQEDKIATNSKTETFVALRLFLNNPRWKDVPFYIRTGKKLNKKSAEIIVQFKPLSEVMPINYYSEVEPNLLIIKIQPDEGVGFQFNAKKPGTLGKIETVSMNFCQNCNAGTNSPEAYEKLLLDVIAGDSTRFARWDEVEHSWIFMDQILSCWNDNESFIEDYKDGSTGPEQADALLEKDQRKWWDL